MTRIFLLALVGVVPCQANLPGNPISAFNPMSTNTIVNGIDHNTNRSCAMHDAQVGGEAMPTKSKTVLSIIWLFGLGQCGVDRCYMGNWCLGILKGITLGGCGIWHLIDWVIELKNFFDMGSWMDTLGIRGCFESSHLDRAWWIGLIGLILAICGCCFGGLGGIGGGGGLAAMMGGKKKKKAATYDDDSSYTSEYDY